MTFDNIFTAYYRMYRGEATVPDSTDDEYTIALSFANEAINRWANVDGVYWKELFTNLQDSTQISPALTTTISTGVTSYTAPTDMREAGGSVRVLDADGKVVQTYPIINPQERQFKGDDATFAYFTGNPTAGFTMHLNPSPDASLNGLEFDYVYYKKPTEFTTGSSTTDMANPYFIVHHMLATRFLIDNNPGYSVSKRDAEDALKNMQIDNMSGTWANPPTVRDNSGTTWGW